MTSNIWSINRTWTNFTKSKTYDYIIIVLIFVSLMNSITSRSMGLLQNDSITLEGYMNMFFVDEDKDKIASYQVRDIFSICRCCWDVATYKWNVHNGKMDIISFVVRYRFQPHLTVNFEVWVNVWSRRICICGILYFKLNGINAINEIEKPLYEVCLKRIKEQIGE